MCLRANQFQKPRVVGSVQQPVSPPEAPSTQPKSSDHEHLLYVQKLAYFAQCRPSLRIGFARFAFMAYSPVQSPTPPFHCSQKKTPSPKFGSKKKVFILSDSMLIPLMRSYASAPAHFQEGAVESVPWRCILHTPSAGPRRFCTTQKSAPNLHPPPDIRPPAPELLVGPQGRHWPCTANAEEGQPPSSPAPLKIVAAPGGLCLSTALPCACACACGTQTLWPLGLVPMRCRKRGGWGVKAN